MKASILVPLYNEEEFVATLLDRVIQAHLPNGLDREVIAADDGSTDGSVQEVERVQAKHLGLVAQRKGLEAPNNQLPAT